MCCIDLMNNKGTVKVYKDIKSARTVNSATHSCNIIVARRRQRSELRHLPERRQHARALPRCQL